MEARTVQERDVELFGDVYCFRGSEPASRVCRRHQSDILFLIFKDPETWDVWLLVVPLARLTMMLATGHAKQGE